MKLPFLVPLVAYFRRNPPKPPTVSQKGVQAQAIQLLIANGSITAWDVQQIGTTDARKMFTRLRKLGLLYDSDDACGHRMAPNKSGHGKHKVHFWTRKIPENWLKAPNVEKRKRTRGGCM